MPSWLPMTRPSCGCTPDGRRLLSICMATAGVPSSSPGPPSSEPIWSARASPTSCSPAPARARRGTCDASSPPTPTGSPRSMPGQAPAGFMPSLTDTKRIYCAVAACAVVVYLGALWNRFAMDDLYVIVFNPLVHSASGVWRAFGAPYWPPEYGGKMYRPLVMATFAIDRLADGAAWFHAMNLLWHAAAAVVVA